MNNNKNKKLESIFENMSDKDLEKFFEDCDIEYTKVEKGKGGIFITDDIEHNKDYINKEKLINRLVKRQGKYLTRMKEIEIKDKDFLNNKEHIRCEAIGLELLDLINLLEQNLLV